MSSKGSGPSKRGTFVVSLDTELGWGCFDTVGVDHYREAYENTRAVIDGLCDLFDAYRAPTTWAVVTHMLTDCGGRHDEPDPEFDWIDSWYGRAPCSAGVDRDLWYAPDVLERIRSADVDHELGVHGYSHMILGAPGCTRAAATAEIRRAMEVVEEFDLDVETFVFPRNRIGHLDVLEEFGVEYYRGLDARWYEASAPRPLRRVCRFGDEFTRRTPPTVTPRARAGMVELPGSQIFRPDDGYWRYTPPGTQVERAKKGLERAADRGEVFHLWFHPFNFGSDPEGHLDLFERVLSYAADLRRDDRLEILPIDEACRNVR
ncbi:hypothetical protein BRC81_11755 [Halobacteriales archaeon QS_1_68_20]|nr:MAG: hypothetical protein BRC81_11755 [Halobacteriales archaeon QS_1_68_20]